MYSCVFETNILMANDVRSEICKFKKYRVCLYSETGRAPRCFKFLLQGFEKPVAAGQIKVVVIERHNHGT